MHKHTWTSPMPAVSTGEFLRNLWYKKVFCHTSSSYQLQLLIGLLCAGRCTQQLGNEINGHKSEIRVKPDPSLGREKRNNWLWNWMPAQQNWIVSYFFSIKNYARVQWDEALQLIIQSVSFRGLLPICLPKAVHMHARRQCVDGISRPASVCKSCLESAKCHRL